MNEQTHVAIEMVRATVARGRSVTIGIVAGYQQIGDAIRPVFEHRVVGPGEVVQVAADELPLLIQNGYVDDPAADRAEAVIVQDGSPPGSSVAGRQA